MNADSGGRRARPHLELTSPGVPRTGPSQETRPPGAQIGTRGSLWCSHSSCLKEQAPPIPHGCTFTPWNVRLSCIL